MNTSNSQGGATFQATAAISEWRRVVLDATGKVAHASADEAGIGVALHSAPAGGYVTVKLWNAPGTFFLWHSAGCTTGEAIYAAADGAVAETGDLTLGVALSDAAADSVVEAAVVTFTPQVTSSASAPSAPAHAGRTALHVRWTDAGAATFHSLYAWSPTAQTWVPIIEG